MTFEKNQLLDVTFVDITHEGAGVAKPEGIPIFVPYGIPGEKAQIKITKMHKAHGFGRLVEIYEESPDRVEPACPVYKQCGGCHLQQLSYDAQLLAKRKIVRDALERIGKLQNVEVKPVIGMTDPWQYRNKVQVPIAEQSGKLVAGFYTKRSHDVVAMDHCLIQMEANDQAVQIVKNICDKYGMKAYNEQTHSGVLRHVLARFAAETGELMIVLVTRISTIPNKQVIADEIVAALPNLKSLVLNVNPTVTNVILGDRNKTLWGQDYIVDRIAGLEFEISPHSFYQVNPVQAEVLYEKVLQFAGLTDEEIVIDAYCGIGTISLLLAKQAKQVIGIEIIDQAVEDAKRNAQRNGISNVEFIVGAAEAILGKKEVTEVSTDVDQDDSAEAVTVLDEVEARDFNADVVVVDPPRKGCDRALLDAIVNIAPSRIVYVSCNPATLARDLQVLVDGGYEVKEVQPVDMFPMTGHIECVVGLYKK